MLTWFVGGFLVACGFSSAGPCYYARIGLGELYTPLMQALHAPRPTTASGRSARRTSSGTASPASDPVRPASRPSRRCTWRAPRCSRWRRATSAAPPSPSAAVYWAMILLGSVLLGWHYAVDGYAAALIAVLVWRIAGRYGRRSRAIRSRGDAPAQPGQGGRDVSNRPLTATSPPAAATSAPPRGCARSPARTGCRGRRPG